jgi:hypothetical protein
VDRYLRGRLIPFVRVGKHVLLSFDRLCQWLSEPRKAEKNPDEEMEVQPNSPEHDEAEERFRQRCADETRRLRILERSEEQRRLFKRLFELVDKEAMTEDEKDEQAEIEERLEVLAAEAKADENEEKSEFFEFFSGIPRPELNRVYELLCGWRKGG